MTTKFSPEFKRECVQLVLLHNYTQPEAAKAVDECQYLCTEAMDLSASE